MTPSALSISFSCDIDGRASGLGPEALPVLSPTASRIARAKRALVSVLTTSSPQTSKGLKPGNKAC